jgi:ADP-ribose pyrophosphatase YjhB (NUDIX family)
MSFEGSYLWRLRQTVGHDLVLQPGAAVAAQREDGKVLFIRRGDNGVWALPGGAAEEGGSFARTAVDELREETGLVVEPADLIPMACFSDAERHTLHYPNGDVAHYFSMCFIARRWQGEPVPDGEESLEVAFGDRPIRRSRSRTRPHASLSSCSPTCAPAPSRSADGG